MVNSGFLQKVPTNSDFVKKKDLLNQREIDIRQTMKEIVQNYPSVHQQRKIIRKEYHSKLKEVESLIQKKKREEIAKNFNLSQEVVIEQKEVRDPKVQFQESLAQTLAKSQNKKELINILKRKLVNLAQSNPQDHLKLLDSFLKSKIVKKHTQAQKKHYLSSKISDAIEVAEGYH